MLVRRTQIKCIKGCSSEDKNQKDSGSMRVWANAKILARTTGKHGVIIHENGKSVGGTFGVRLAVHFGTC